MAYTPHNWVVGELLRAEDLNHLEQGVLNEQIGPQGPAVPPGETGDIGPQGEPGADGESAYQIAVDEGFEGTKAEWLASLQGPPGPQGEPGGGVTDQELNDLKEQLQDYTDTKVQAAKSSILTILDDDYPLGIGITAIVALTQEQYDALDDKISNRLYVIKD